MLLEVGSYADQLLPVWLTPFPLQLIGKLDLHPYLCSLKTKAILLVGCFLTQVILL